MLLYRSSRITLTEHVTLDEVFDAYYDCRRHKRSKRSAVAYEMDYEINNCQLWQELNSQTYHPTTSIAFCVTRPKLREVFAANFRDRIVHHLFIRRILPAVENRMTDHAYACREGKGTLYGVRDVAAMMRPGCYRVKGDIKAFFMSIDRQILLRLVREVVSEACPIDTDWWQWLGELLVMHRPELDCEIHGNKALFDKLPADKTLFKTNGRGLPIGNLTSQILAGLYMAAFDIHMIIFLGPKGGFGRYADDFVMQHPDHDHLLRALEEARRWLWEHRRLTLHPRKIEIQPSAHGLVFTGCRIRSGVMMPAPRLRRNALSLVQQWGRCSDHTDEQRQRLVSRYNSYCGLLLPYASWNLRRVMWRQLGDYNHINLINNKKLIAL